MSELIKPYEISVWEDVLVKDEETGASYFKERKIADIGSNLMTAPNKAYDVTLHKNKNGEKTLSFSIKSRYYDPIVEQMVDNPFVPFLINERKIKLYYDNEWYDFIIKEQTESSEEYEWHYECQDAFVLELSKTGYNITFNSELGNNQGTALELAMATLENTDWKVADIDVEPPKVNEPVYYATLETDVTVKDLDDNSDVIIPAQTPIFLFYSYINKDNGKFIQFIKQADEYDIDSNNNITAKNYRFDKELFIDEGIIKDENDNVIITYSDLYLEHQVYRIVYKQLTTYDPVMGRTVDRYATDDVNIFHYSDYVYTSSDVVVSYITNGSNFNTYGEGETTNPLQGWSKYAGKDTDRPDIQLTTFPEEISDTLIPLDAIRQTEGYIEAKYQHSLLPNQIQTEDCGDFIFNSGIENNSSLVGHISQGEKFLLRWRAAKSEADGDKSKRELKALKNNALGVVVGFYTQETEPDTKISYNQLDKTNIILHFHGEGTELNNRITSGYFEDENYKNYIVDGVVQYPSTRYIYVDEETGEERIWKASDQKYIEYDPDDENSFFNYYYLVATAETGITSELLSDPKTKIGIFFYINEESAEPNEDIASYYYYFQDIQLTRYYEDANGEPIVLGNVPTALNREVDYFYIEPKKGAVAENINTYATLEALALNEGININEIRPVYSNDNVVFMDNKGQLFYSRRNQKPNPPYDLFYVKGYSLEKTLSIEASKSNCFNILQTIAETFECWLELEVFHNEDGSIALNSDHKPTKYVYLRRYAGKDNFAGFKYGINLNSIERVTDSNEIVTKLIVDGSQSDVTDSGMVSIANANSNISGESYIFNFDYYYNNGLLEKEAVETDYLDYQQKIQDINKLRSEIAEKKESLENSLNKLSANQNVYVTLLTTAKENLTKALEKFDNLTGYSYEDYQGLTEQEREEKIGNLSEIDTIYDTIGEIYVNGMTINNYEGLSTVTTDEYKKIQEELFGRASHNFSVSKIKDESINQWFIKITLDDYITPFSFQIGDNSYTTSINQKSFYIKVLEQEFTISNIIYKTGEEGYKLYNDKGKEITNHTIYADPAVIQRFTLIPNNPIESLQDKIDDLIEEKKQIIAEFENRYSRFILEGNWSSNEYISDELYYLDALNLSRISAFPKVTYNIQVTEISGLEDYVDYSFNTGDKTYIEDTEFFGWIHDGDVLTPAREEVIVSEIEWNLDDPSQNSITVQNYKTNFEDLFQRIQATVQTVQYNETVYPKTNSFVNSDGTIKETVLSTSLDKVMGKRMALTSDGAVSIDENSILIKNLTNNANYVRINSEGIQISSDGGVTWATAVSGRGMDSGEVFTGTIDTDNIIIGGKTNSSFRWDSNGLNAYRSYLDEGQEGQVKRHDFRNYVRFDEYGVYGVQNAEEFKAKSLNEVKETASFGITWDGFFIKNRYGNGYVSISNDNDFQVFYGVGAEAKERIKIGALEWKDEEGHITTIPQESDPTKYGIRINDNKGNPVFAVRNDGSLDVVGHITAQALTIRSGDEEYNGWDAINITGYSLVITMGDYIGNTQVYLYPHLYFNGIEQFPEHESGQEPTDEQKEKFYNNFIWYKNNSTTGILGDWRNEGRIIANRDSSYRLTYEFDDGSTEESVPIEIVKVDPAEYITDVDDYKIQIHPKIWEGADCLYLDDSGNISASGKVTATGYNIGNTSLVDFFYPVGSVYQTYLSEFNPNVSWGGEWELLDEGYVLLSGSEDGDFIAGNPYGDNEKAITANDLPTHTHTMSHTHEMAHTHTLNSHTHNITGSTTRWVAGINDPNNKGHNIYFANINDSGSGLKVMALSGTTSNATIGEYQTTGGNNANTSNSSITNTKGSSAANTGNNTTTENKFNVMQQSFAVYIWYRIA